MAILHTSQRRFAHASISRGVRRGGGGGGGGLGGSGSGESPLLALNFFFLICVQGKYVTSSEG